MQMATIRLTRYLSCNIPKFPHQPICQSLRPSTFLLPTTRCFSSCTILRNNSRSKAQDERAESPPPNLQLKGRRRKRNIAILAFVLLAANALLYNQSPPTTISEIFSPPSFTPFTIVKREVISPTSIILTLRPNISPQPSSASKDPFREFWDRGPWYVEIKQPDLQIARDYTPLPPAQDSDGNEKGYLRFYIRKEHKGEVSGYLHNLPVGAKVECRGPHHGGIDVGRGSGVNEVLFLAGGTGIAPALQVAYTVLERRGEGALEEPRVRIVWANRKREECLGAELEMGDSPGFIEGRKMGVLVRQLKGLQKKYPGRLAVEYLVDEEGTLLDKRQVGELVKQNDGRLGTGDERLLCVSGPEGFVNLIAGPKLWENGKEGQGKVDGILGQLGLRDWRVWKL